MFAEDHAGSGKTIDLTPTWTGILPALAQLYIQRDKGGMAELNRMAEIADAAGKNHKLDVARWAFLMVVAARPGHLDRGYLKEKVIAIWKADEVEEIRGRLDLEGQREFDAWMDSYEEAL